MVNVTAAVSSSIPTGLGNDKPEAPDSTKLLPHGDAPGDRKAGPSDAMQDPVSSHSPEISNSERNQLEAISDHDLIAAAKRLSDSVKFHERKTVEDFWRLGEALTQLRERPAVKGRWREVLKEIGINPTTDNHACRLHAQVSSVEQLKRYRNKTEALRKLGILVEPSKAAEQPAADHSTKADPANATQAAKSRPSTVRNEVKAVAQEDQTSDTVEHTGSVSGEAKSTEPITADEPPPTPLTTLSQIATRLEYLAQDDFELTPEVIAQLARIAEACDLLRGRTVEVASAAA